MTWFGFPFAAEPSGPSMRQRILRALAMGPITGQTALIAEVSKGGWTPRDQRDFNAALTIAISDGEVSETKRQVPGTGHEGPPVFEYVYRNTLPKGVKP